MGAGKGVWTHNHLVPKPCVEVVGWCGGCRPHLGPVCHVGALDAVRAIGAVPALCESAP